MQRLFISSSEPEGASRGKQVQRSSPQSSTPPHSPVPRFPIRHRVLLQRIQGAQMRYREPRSPIVVSESGEESEDEVIEAADSTAISRVVSTILESEALESSEENLFNDPVVVPNTTQESLEEVANTNDSAAGFQEKDQPKDPSKREMGRIHRKDDVSNANLAEDKIKGIFKYPCCDSLCLRHFGREEVRNHRTYYYGLTATEKNILLRGCLEQSHQGRSGYVVNGKQFCRQGFKKLYSVGNNRLQRVSEDIFCRVRNETFSKDKSTTHIGLVQWLNQFFATNVECLPNKDIFHLPDNWTKLEVFDAFKNEVLSREEAGMTYSWFCRIWNLEFPRVRIPKRSRFSTCAPCTEFKALRDKATLEAEKSKLIVIFE